MLALGLCDAEGLTEADAELEGDWLADGLTEALALLDGEVEALGLAEADGLVEADALELGDADAEGLTEGETEEEAPAVSSYSTSNHRAVTLASLVLPVEIFTPI